VALRDDAEWRACRASGFTTQTDHTAGRSTLHVTLTPEAGGTATLYGLEAR
jgi:hypothetical protein